MSIDWAFHQDIVHRPVISRDGWNKPTYGVDANVKGRWQYKQTLVRAANGNEEMTDSFVMLPITIDTNIDDLLGYEGKFYTVVSREAAVELYGVKSHWQVYAKSRDAQ